MAVLLIARLRGGGAGGEPIVFLFNFLLPLLNVPLEDVGDVARSRVRGIVSSHARSSFHSQILADLLSSPLTSLLLSRPAPLLVG
jgi:hypothetical protein